jgi:hypothetical protein
MTVLLSPVGGVAAQFFDNNGNPLSGGKLYSYSAGTTTPAATYTSSLGVTAHTNPIVLDAGGRVPGGEIWLTDGVIYKFVLQTSTNVLIATYDNIVGINSNFVNFTAEQEIQTATAGQTVFNLTTTQYQPGTNSLSVFVDGVNQYGPGAQYAYLETDSDTVTFVSGLHVGASVKFTTATQTTGNATDASVVSYTPPFTGSVTTNVEAKLAQTVSVIDFGADSTGSANASVAFIAALAASSAVYVPPGTYRFDAAVTVPANKKLFGGNRQSTTLLHNFNGNMFILSDGAALEGLTIDGNGATYTGQGVTCTGTNGKQLIQDCSIIDFAAACIYFESLAGSQSTVNNVLAYQTNGTSGSGNFAIVIQDTGSPVAQAVPRKFSQIESNGFCSFFFGSTNNVYITSSFLGDLLYTINSIGVFISNCRIANQAALTINGTTHIINGSDIAPQITLGTTVGSAAANTLTLTGNVYNNPPVVDNFGTANIIEQQLSSYTCTLSAGGSPASLGNGTLAASFARTGSATYVSIALTLGSTTSLGTGQISFSLPYQVRGANHVGTVRMVAGGVNFTGVCTASFGNNTVALVRDTSGAVTFNSPGVFTTGDVIQISIVYT